MLAKPEKCELARIPSELISGVQTPCLLVGLGYIDILDCSNLIRRWEATLPVVGRGLEAQHYGLNRGEDMDYAKFTSSFGEASSAIGS